MPFMAEAACCGFWVPAGITLLGAVNRKDDHDARNFAHRLTPLPAASLPCFFFLQHHSIRIGTRNGVVGGTAVTRLHNEIGNLQVCKPSEAVPLVKCWRATVLTKWHALC